MTEEEYRQEWLKGLHNTDYNNCRFSDDKTKFAKDWIKNIMPTVNLENPQNIVDRINWCKIYDMTPEKALWSNKIWAYCQLRMMGLEELQINPAYIFNGNKFTFEQFNTLPDGKWFFRCNHGSGWNMRFEKKKGNDPTYLIKKLNEWLFLDYSYIGGWEWQYHNMKKGVIVQPDLGKLLDWQFWCEDGKIEGVQLSVKLGKNLEEYQVFCDENGNEPPWVLGMEPMQRKMTPSRKVILEKMKPYVLQLAKGFKFVRVDMYCIEGQPKFSELTFTPCSGQIKLIKD